MEPVQLTIIQRTTTFVKFFIRVAGVIGGVFVCMGYAIRFTNRAVSVYTGADSDANAGAIGAEASGASRLKGKWGGGALRSRMSETSRVVRQGNSWVVEGAPGGTSPYGSPMSGYAHTPTHTPSSSIYMAPSSPGLSPYAPTSAHLGSNPGTPVGLGFAPTSPAYLGGHSRQSSLSPAQSPYIPTSPYSPPAAPGSLGYNNFPPTPNAQTTHVNGSSGPPPRRSPSIGGGKKDD